MVMSVLIIIIMCTWFYMYKDFKRINIFSMYVVGIFLSFILLTLVYKIKQHSDIDIQAQILTIGYIFLTTVILILLIKFFIPKHYTNLMLFDFIIQRASCVSVPIVIILSAFSFGTVLYFFKTYGFIFRLPELSDLNAVNTYGIVISSFVIPIFYLLLIIILSSKHRTRLPYYLYTVIFGLILVYFLFYSRRELLLALLLIVFILMYKKKKNIFSVYKIPIMLVFLLFVFIANNIYENIRLDIAESIMAGTSFELNKNILELAFDSEASEANVQDRMAIFDFTSLLMNQLINKNISPTYGAILNQNILNTIPSILYTNKKVLSSDEMIAQFMHIRSTDYPTNILASFLVDFGIFAVVLYPLFMILYIVFILFLLKINKNKNLLYLIIVTYSIYTLFNIEGSITGMIINIRNIILLSILYKSLSNIYLIIKIKRKQK
ncbi:O-antigen polymerase [Sulfurospirillum sp. 1612]|uniref:O-antigen polymerase n=1 Tax=Sulfurospirillum sp. 1612 TaxID=3094835 RepID=UPI002F92BD24